MHIYAYADKTSTCWNGLMKQIQLYFFYNLYLKLGTYIVGPKK